MGELEINNQNWKHKRSMFQNLRSCKKRRDVITPTLKIMIPVNL